MTLSSPSPGRPYGGTSAIDRAADRRRRLMSAALDLVGESGVESLTVGSVCGRASVAKRYFYEGFATLEDLLSATLAEALGQVTVEIEAIESSRHDGDIRPLLEAAVEAVLRVFDDPRVARIYLESPGHAGLRSARDAAVAGFVDQFLEVLQTEDRESARALAHVMVAGTTEVVAMWLRGDLRLSRELLVKRLVDLGAGAARLIRNS